MASCGQRRGGTQTNALAAMRSARIQRDIISPSRSRARQVTNIDVQNKDPSMCCVSTNTDHAPFPVNSFTTKHKLCNLFATSHGNTVDSQQELEVTQDPIQLQGGLRCVLMPVPTRQVMGLLVSLQKIQHRIPHFMNLRLVSAGLFELLCRDPHPLPG